MHNFFIDSSPPSDGGIHLSCYPDEQTEAQKSGSSFGVTKPAGWGVGRCEMVSFQTGCSLQPQKLSPKNGAWVSQDGMSDGLLTKWLSIGSCNDPFLMFDQFAGEAYRTWKCFPFYQDMLKDVVEHPDGRHESNNVCGKEYRASCLLWACHSPSTSMCSPVWKIAKLCTRGILCRLPHIGPSNC